MAFLVPSAVPQDLLLIQDIIGVPEPVPQKPAPKFEDDIDSSDSESDNGGSEDEIEADLVKVGEDDELKQLRAAPTDSTSESDSSSDSDSSDDEQPAKVHIKDLDAEDDDESGGVAAPTATYFQTKNEIVETDIAVPDIEEVGPDEVLERVGEVMSIIDKTVIVKGAPAELLARTSDQTLDCDTLLVFEDRKVLGYIYETFGPTSQPLYQVKFSASYPLDTEKVQLSRPVFHVPQRSRFVFVSQIKRFKGSDASNMHDEEPADDELEFSDDEAEATYKRETKRKRGESRANSVVSSRASTPALMRDQDMAYLERNPYDDHSPYDDNFGSGPSRPAPLSYDDPYSDEYNNVMPVDVEPPAPVPPNRSNSARIDFEGSAGRGRGRGRGRGSVFDQGRGRGRGRERERGGRGRGNNDRSSSRSWEPRSAITRGSMEQDPYDPHNQHHPPRSLSPTSMAIARATGQFPDGSEFAPQPSGPPTSTTPWAFDPSQQQFNYGYPPFVQPHINPRFASAFGMNMEFQQAQPHPYYQPQPQPQTGGSWTDEWTVHGANDSSNNDPRP